MSSVMVVWEMETGFIGCLIWAECKMLKTKRWVVRLPRASLFRKKIFTTEAQRHRAVTIYLQFTTYCVLALITYFGPAHSLLNQRPVEPDTDHRSPITDHRLGVPTRAPSPITVTDYA